MKFVLPLLLMLVARADVQLSLQQQDGQLTILNGETTVLTYHLDELAPPPEVGDRFRRSGFIHPLCTPRGGALTSIHAKDHYHHMGLWHAWVKTKHGKAEPDFWNLGKGSGRVRFAQLLGISRQLGEAGFRVRQEQVAYKKKKEVVVLDEILAIRAQVQDEVNIIDYHLTQTNVSGVELELPAHRYGGPLAYRGPHSWNEQNSEYLTSEGKTRVDSHTTRARWCAVFGPTEQGEATLAFLCHPENMDFPQRLRTWPSGQMFLNWAAVQETSMSIHAGDSVTWKYRLLTADRKLTAEEIESHWKVWTP